MTVYKFTSIDRTLDFIKPLLIEGKHSVYVRTFYKEYPWETQIDYYEVTVQEIKDEELKGVPDFDWKVRDKEPL